MAFKNWDATTPANNASQSSVDFSENQLPSTVNDSARQLMADLKAAVPLVVQPVSAMRTITQRDSPLVWATQANVSTTASEVVAYVWRASMTATDNGLSLIKPTSISSSVSGGVGVWQAVGLLNKPDASGNLRIGKNIVFDLATGGIDFSADTDDGSGVAAEVLDDYEEGTFDPVFRAASGSFSASGTPTYNIQIGTYTKTGNICEFHLRLQTSAINAGNASGALLIEGLPFTCANNGSVAATVGFASDWGGETPAKALVVGNDTTLQLYYRTSVSGDDQTTQASDVDVLTVGNVNFVIIESSYRVA